MEFKQMHTTVTIAQGGTASTAITPPPWASLMGFYFPDMDAGAVDLEASKDGGTTWEDVLDITDGQKLVALASGSDPGWADVSDHVKPFLGVKAGGSVDDYIQFRLVSATAQTTAAVTIDVYFKG